MKRFTPLLAAAVLFAMLPIGPAQAVEVTHRLDLKAGETKTWDGTAAVGANVNYNGIVDEPTARTCSADIQTKCEYALVSLTNVVPDTDADGKVNKSVTFTLDSYSLESPLSDFALSVYTTDKDGSIRGDELGTSDNSDVPDPDEQVAFAVQTTRLEPTKYFLVEVAYFTSLNASYKGTVKF
jgi:hypothetical protein